MTSPRKNEKTTNFLKMKKKKSAVSMPEPLTTIVLKEAVKHTVKHVGEQLQDSPNAQMKMMAALSSVKLQNSVDTEHACEISDYKFNFNTLFPDSDKGKSLLIIDNVSNLVDRNDFESSMETLCI